MSDQSNVQKTLLVEGMKNYNIEFMGIQEHNLKEECLMDFTATDEK